MNSPETVLIQRLGTIVWPYRWYLLPAILCMILMASTSGAIALLVQPILDTVFIEQNKSMLYTLPAIVMGVFFLRGVAYFGHSYLMEFVGQKVARTLQIQLYGHLLQMDLHFFFSHATGSLMSRVTFDTQMLKQAATSIIAGLLREGMTLLILMGVLFYRDSELATISLFVMPIAGYLILRFGRRMRRLSRSRQEMMEDLTSHLEETFSGLRIIKAFGMERFERSAFRRLTKRVLKNLLRTAVVRAITNPSMDLIAGCAISAVILYAGQAVMSGETTTGTFFSFLTAMLMAYTPIKRLTNINNALQESLAAASRIFELIDTKPGIIDMPHAVTLPPIRKSLCFNQIHFSYGETLPEVLRNITLKIQVGERVALVGKSGSGKTTLVHLVPRFFDVTKGSITIDETDITTVTQSSLRSQIAMVTQEIILFNDTVRNNIAYGRETYTQAEVEAAAEAANALAFIRELPDGFETIIGDRGIKLSGGQRQRLSIARSLLKNAPILILDEATSALDTESERAVQGALENLMRNRTSLVIAHRLSTIRNADRIVVLKDGTIAESGTHRELLALEGEYARLHAMQFLDSNPSNSPSSSTVQVGSPPHPRP